MKKFISYVRIDKKLLSQFALVFVAFLIMVVIGSVFGARIVTRNVASYGSETINSSAETIKAYLGEYKTTLEDISFSMERLRSEGASIDELQEDLASWTNWILSKDEYESFLSIYSAVDGVMIDGQYVEPPEGYVPESRPWYIGALEKNGEVHYCDPYIDIRTGNYVLTVSKVMIDGNNKVFGVIAIDVFITTTYEFVNSLRLMNSGYGMLLDTNRNIVIHPSADLIGTPMEEVNDGAGGYTEIASQLALGKDITAFNYTSYAGEKSVAFFKKLYNGWYVGIISPRSAYYNDVYTMITLLSVVGFILMISLCMVMAYLHIEKSRSDEANRIKSSFLASMSHEIRTPMNAIIGMTDLLLSEPLNSRQKSYVSDISESSHSLLGIINDILDHSKIEAGKVELNPIDYDFGLFIDNIGSMFRYVVQKKELEFKFEKEGEMPKCLYGDDIRLRQVLTNILGNAVKFTSAGYVRLKVAAAGETLIFIIEDTGMGIRKDDLSKLFKPFIQADIQKNRKTTGTGLGLSISKAFVEMMGGKITVDSVYGQGTVFTVIIPLTIGDESAIRYDDKEEKENAFFAPDAKILVVDDNEINLKVARGLLNLYKIDAQTASSGKEAIGLIKENSYDIVFMDHMMPEMDGVETTNEIRRLGGRHKQQIIIVLTANAVQGAREMFLANGFNDFVSKPIDIHALSKALMNWLPDEKISKRTETAPEQPAEGEKEDEAAPGSFMDSIKQISGINTEIGLSHVSGLEDMYQETIELFYLKLLNDCDKMEGFLNNKDLPNLAISVHGMKSSLATIGVVELSEMAYTLETASKDEKLQYCEDHLPEFLVKLRFLHEQLSAAMPNEEAAQPRPEGDIEYLRENLQAALAAANDFDGDLAMESINKLLDYDYGQQTNGLLENTSRALKDFEFDAAIEFLNGILNT